MNANEALVEILSILVERIKVHEDALLACQDVETRFFIAGGLFSLEEMRKKIRELA